MPFFVASTAYRIIFDANHDPQLLISDTGFVEDANPAALVFFSRKSLIGEDFCKLFPKDGVTALQKLWNMKKKKQIRLAPLEFFTQSGETIFIEISLFPDVLPEQTLVIFRDTTARVVAQRQRDQFLALSGHELKTPLAVIKAFTQLLQTLTAPIRNKKIDRYLAHIDEKTNLLTGLINGMLDAIRLGEGKMSFKDEQIDFDKLVGEIVFEIQKTYPGEKIQLSGITHSVVVADKHRCMQLISNIIMNAIKYSPPASPVKIDVSEVGGLVRLSVADQGRGIPKAEQSKLFLPFFRGSDARKQSTPGLGLGLYLAKKVIRHYNGSITVKSTYRKGSIFTIELPALAN